MLNEKDTLLKTNRQLSKKLETFEGRLTIENSKLQSIQKENTDLKENLKESKREKGKLQKLLDTQSVMLGRYFNFLTFIESINKNIKSIEGNKFDSLTKKNNLLTERSKNIEALKANNEKLKREIMNLKLEVRIYEAAQSMVQRLSPNLFLYT